MLGDVRMWASKGPRGYPESVGAISVSKELEA